jgi:hypothetical protein
MERGIVRFAGVTRGGGYKHLPLYIEGLGRKGVGMGVAACVSSVDATVGFGRMINRGGVVVVEGDKSVWQLGGRIDRNLP